MSAEITITPSLKTTHLENLKHATKIVRRSLVLIILVAVLKAVGGYFTNIVALAGDAVGSVTDIISNSAILIGLTASQKKANSNFTYGLHRIETLVTFVVSFIVVYLGGKIFLASHDRFYVAPHTTAHGLGIAAAIISILFSVATFFYQYRTGLKINSKALMASAFDKRNDAFVSCGVLVSVIADKFDIPFIEGTVGIFIAGMIIWNGLQHGYEAVLYLLDYWDNPEITSQIKKILSDSSMVTSITNIRLRHAGTFIYGEAFIQVNPFVESKDLRDELHRLERHIEDSVEHLGDLVLFIDPPIPDTAIIALPIVNDNGLSSKIATDADTPCKILILKIANGKIQSSHNVTSELHMKNISEISNIVKREKINIFVSSLITPALYYNLRLNNVKVYPHLLEVESVKDTLKLLLIDL